MAKNSPGKPARNLANRSRLTRFFMARRRLLSSMGAGLVLLAVLPDSFRLATRLLLAWDLTAVIYISGIDRVPRRRLVGCGHLDWSHRPRGGLFLLGGGGGCGRSHCASSASLSVSPPGRGPG